MTDASTATSLRVLIVEHDVADAELSVHTLERAGFAVKADIVATPAEFRECLRKSTYDIVLADYRLPSWTGMDALKELRALGFDTPLILVTGTLGDERAVECVKGGAADYVLKENTGRLAIAVHRALHEYWSRAELARAATRTREFEIQAREREERFAQLADNISEVFYLMDADYTRTLFINSAYEKIWGRTTQSLYDNPMSFADAVHPEDRAMLFEHVARMQRGEASERIVFRIVRPDGETRWVAARATPVRNAKGEVDRISGVALDITEQRSAQLALEESEIRFRKLVDAAFDGIVISRRGIIHEANRGFLDMFGLTSDDEAIGHSVLDFCAPESRELVEQRMRNGAEEPYHIVGVKKDGKKIRVEVTARDHQIDGQPGRITALRDVTDQHTLEEQFRQAQKMEAVGRLAGGVAHDFNNLLTVISSYSEFIHSEFGENDPRRADVEEIIRAAQGAASLTRQLLAFSRQEVIQPRRVAVPELLRSVEKLLRRLIGEDIVLTTRLSDEPLVVNVDPGQFEQVLMNLAVNARDAMPTGGTLTIETARVEFDQAFADAHWPAVVGTFAMVAMSDTGIGMDEQTQERIFEPFFTTKEVGTGTGLGLATVYGIVKQSGGFIWVYSELGAGTTFKVYLPLVAEPEVAAPAREVAELPRGAEVVMVVEDAAAVRAAVVRILSKLGYTVVEAPSAKAALDLLRHGQKKVDLLMTDVVMPEMSGRELAEAFLAFRPDGKVLYMSGYTDDAVLRHGVLSSAVAFIQKPFTPEALATKLRAALGA